MKKVLKIAGLSLLGLLVILTFVFLWQKSRPKEVVYHIETVTKGKIEKRTVATGKVEPRNEILIKPQMSGIISEVYKPVSYTHLHGSQSQLRSTGQASSLGR